MKVLLFLLLSASYALSQCQANPAPNPADPDDPKTTCVGPLAVTGAMPSWWRFQIGGTAPTPKPGFIFLDASSGVLRESDNGQPYRSLVGPAGANGTNGVDGLPGKDGSNGVNGKDGLPGRDGTNGTNGMDGKNGLPGPQGPPGPSLTNCTVTNISFSPTIIMTLICH